MDILAMHGPDAEREAESTWWITNLSPHKPGGLFLKKKKAFSSQSIARSKDETILSNI